MTTTVRHFVKRIRSPFGFNDRKPLFFALVSVLLYLISAKSFADILDKSIRLDIPPNTRLEDALILWGSTTGVTVMMNTSTVRNQTAESVHGTLSARKALAIILSRSGLSYIEDGARIKVLPQTGSQRSVGRDDDLQRRLASDFLSAAPTPGGLDDRTGSDSSGTQPDSRNRRLDEVIVTAQKRSEALQDVPVPVTALSGATLTENNQLRLQDYFTSVPGLTVVTGGFNGAAVLTIRGLSSIGGNNTVSIVVDDVPFGAVSPIALGGEAPDIDPGDLQRIEVLRGPQGTLYGASSIGGLVKFVTVDPTTDALTGRIQVGTSAVHNGAQPGYSVRGSINIPLNDTFAIRGSAFARETPGYINNPVLQSDGVNKELVEGGRMVGLWTPLDGFSLKVSAMLQHSRLNGSPEVDIQPGLSDLEQDRLANTGWYDKTIQVYSATLSAKIGNIDLTALTGYNVNRWSDAYDFSTFYGFAAEQNFGVSGVPLYNNAKTDAFTQELRLSAPIGDSFDWLAGLFFNHSTTAFVQRASAEDPTTGQILGSLIDSDSFPTTYKEYAIFADLTYHVTQNFNIQVGGRESHNKQTYHETVIGDTADLYGLPSPVLIPNVDTKDNSFTYLVTPQLKLSPDVMVYARLASGYRAGGPNPNYTIGNLPPGFKPDKTKNYEIGLKGNTPHQFLSFDASLYYIDWKDIQLGFFEPTTGYGYVGNGGAAKSQGAELSAELRPTKLFKLSAWVSLDEAILTRAFPAGGNYGQPGEQLPNVSRFSGNLSAEQQFILSDSVTGFVGSALSYTGSSSGVFRGDPQRQNYPGYAKLDVTAGASYRTWSVAVFGNNLTDRRGTLSGGLGTIYPAAFYYIQPRTVGVTISKSF